MGIQKSAWCWRSNSLLQARGFAKMDEAVTAIEAVKELLAEQAFLKLSNWEIKFLEDMQQRIIDVEEARLSSELLEDSIVFSEVQQDKIWEIYEREIG
jgi:hypothetical protein